MINIDLKYIVGKKFTTQISTTEFTCIGVGTPPDSGFPYVVGLDFNSVNNRTKITTFKFKDVDFKGDITDPSPTLP